MKFLLHTLLLISSIGLTAQEICNNAIDDDNDGFIDLNDSECICTGLIDIEAPSLFENASFEDNSCLPTSFSQMECVEQWIQAGAGTSDYIYNFSNTEKYNPSLSPLDGNAYVGVIDGSSQGIYKEYIGYCLNEALTPGPYVIKLNVGLAGEELAVIGSETEYYNSSQAHIGIYASIDCSELPMGGGNGTWCPSLYNEWVELATTFIEGDAGWHDVKMNFEITEPYSAIAIGPACPSLTVDEQRYYFIDNLTLNELIFFQSLFVDSIGCKARKLRVESDYPDADVQWYLNGIALIGETQQTLITSNEAFGDYQAVVHYEGQCWYSNTYTLEPPEEPQEELTIDIQGEFSFCEGESTFIYIDGTYDAILWNGVQGVYSNEFDATENQNIVISNQNGCVLDTSFQIIEFDSPILDIEPSRTIIGEFESTETLNVFTNSTNYEVSWTPSTNLSCDDCLNPSLTFLENVNYEVLLTDKETGCSNALSIFINIGVTECDLVIPTAFSPNGDGVNDYFEVNADVSCIEEIKSFQIYNRYGQKVLETNNPSNESLLWDGSYTNKKATLGVYLYSIIAELKDGSEKVFKGSITLLK